MFLTFAPHLTTYKPPTFIHTFTLSHSLIPYHQLTVLNLDQFTNGKFYLIDNNLKEV